MMNNSVPRLAKEELKKKLGDANLTVIDLRHPTQWAASTYKIAGAIFEDRDNVPAWAGKYPKDQTLVLYCA
jgi:rhodanese-related sulfurtransferase